ncbi:MAG: hypothetical protein ACE145_10095 [Terriglobia bacterium]
MGADPARLGKPPRKTKVRTGLVLLALVAGTFAYFSYRPAARLRPVPPKTFLDTPKNWDVKRRAAEERVALAYWGVAIEKVQFKYPFGSVLPDDPPPEFLPSEKDSGIDRSPATRARYWKKIRETWDLPEAWDKSYQWSVQWFYDGLVDFQQAVWRNVDSVLRRFRT